jgi:hypothetical protein
MDQRKWNENLKFAMLTIKKKQASNGLLNRGITIRNVHGP